MVMEQFQDVDLECWEHRGRRRFGINPPYICLKGGFESSGVVLKMLNELRTLDPPGQRTMNLKPSQRSGACSKIRFTLSAISDDLTEMSLRMTSGAAEFEFTHEGLSLFENAVLSWRNGLEDFCVHPTERSRGTKDKTSGEVWFWTPLTDP